MSSVPQSGLTQQDPRGHLIDALRRQLGRWESVAGAADAPVFSCGTAAIDRLLPGGGLRHGMLVEWVGRKEQQSSRTATLSLLSAREACREGGALVVIDRQQTFYPPAAAAWGIDLERLIVVWPHNARDEMWAAVESLRSPAVAAMWAAFDRLDNRAFRRLQLAAQAGRTLGLIMRPAHARAGPSWADVRLEVDGKLQNANCKLQIANWRTVQPYRRVQVHLVHCRLGRPGGSTTLEIDDAAHIVREVNEGYRSLTPDTRHLTPSHAHPLPVVAQLADPAPHSLSARA